MRAHCHRRHFLQQTAFAAAGAACGTAAAAEAGPAPSEAEHARADWMEPMDCDVLVIGAGAAGVPAAVAAARQGARVVLAEEDQAPGGAPVDMYVAMPCGFPRFGVYREMLDVLERKYHPTGEPMRPEEEMPGAFYLPSAYAAVIRRLINAEPNLRLLTGARAVEALTADAGARRRVEGALIERSDGRRQPIRAQVAIDATGTGEFAAAAGAEVMYGRESKEVFGEPHAREQADDTVMPCTWMYVSQRLVADAPTPDLRQLQHGNAMDPGIGWYQLNPEAAAQANKGVYLHWGVTVLCRDTRDPVALGEARAEAWERVSEDVDWLMEQDYGAWMAPRIGVRECRRIRGEMVLTENDLKAGIMDSDTVSPSHYYLDAWGEKLTEEEKRVPPYGIPYRALIPRGMEGLLTAGKCISGTHIAMTSYRVQPLVSVMGQAAGVAATLAARNNTALRDVEPEAIRAGQEALGVPINRWMAGETSITG